MQLYTVYLYPETALHVSGGTSTHRQERMQLYLQHLLFVTSLLLPAAILEELELFQLAAIVEELELFQLAAIVEELELFQLAAIVEGLELFQLLHEAAGSSNGVTNSRCCRKLYALLMMGESTARNM